MSIDKRLALFDTDGHWRFAYKKTELATGRYGFVIGRDRFGEAEYTPDLERVIRALVWEGKEIRVKTESRVPGKGGNSLKLGKDKIVGYWVAPELAHLVNGAPSAAMNPSASELAKAGLVGTSVQNASPLSLDEQGTRLLRFLLGRLEAAIPHRPDTYVTYKGAHDALGLKQTAETFGRSLQSQGLNSLAEWAKSRGYPAITGLVVEQESKMPMDGFFKLYGRRNDSFDWWGEQIAAAKAFDWPVDLAPPGDVFVPALGRRIITQKEFQEQLDRRSRTGKAGENVAYAFELERLRLAGCPNPEKYVTHIALDDVGRGYDVESTWAGETRCIEVKSSTALSAPIFISANELSVLGALGDAAWLYRVIVHPDSGTGSVISQTRNPYAVIEEELTPVLWSFDSAVLTTEDQ